MKSSKTSKYSFTLNGVNVEKVEKRYGITLVSNITNFEGNPENSTKISDLSTKLNTEIVSFLDESKKRHNCMVSMLKYEEKNASIKNCYWCRHSIPENCIPIGCPVKYKSNRVIKKYYSEISKDKYIIAENISVEKYKKLQKTNDKRLSFVDGDYYITDGGFCSFNCCMAYIHDNKHNSEYDLSEMLLLQMYYSINEIALPSIDKAPSWKMLKEYGGNLDIEKFRETFNKVEYKYHGKTLLKNQSQAHLFEEKLKF